MGNMPGLVWLLGAYLLGALPVGYLIGRSRGLDIRTMGSGNVGATNVFRVMGPKAGLVCLVLDIAKGLLPVIVLRSWHPAWFWPAAPWWLVGAALATVLGHSKSPFLGFQGGKSVATGAGALFALCPAAGALTLGLWAVTLLFFRFVSLASVLAALLLPLILWFVGAPMPFELFGGLVALYIPWRHRANLGRLMEGTEPRFSLHRKVNP